MAIRVAHGRLRRGGDYRSDLDIAVAADNDLSLPVRMKLAFELEWSTGLKVDLVDLRSARGGFLKEILRGGFFMRKNPRFVGKKYLKMSDHVLFLAPQLAPLPPLQSRSFLSPW